MIYAILISSVSDICYIDIEYKCLNKFAASKYAVQGKGKLMP